MEWFIYHHVDDLKHRIRNLKEKIEQYELMREAETDDFQQGIYAGMVIILEGELWRTENELKSVERIKAEHENMTA